MQYDAAGNVTKIIDGVNSETVDYTYDDLDRLLTASVPAGESYAYDKIGNMTSKAGTTLDYGTTAPKHAVKSHGSTTYTYDANGSMTARGTQTIKYDPEQRPIRIQDGNAISRAAYDGDGVRRKRDDSNGTVHYLGGYERKLADTHNSEVVTKYYSASLGAMSRPVAFRRGGTLHWVGADHLGGTIRVLDSSFTALDGMRYKPYGEDRDTGSALVTDRKFTGQTEDEAAGLYWYASRAYDTEIGRFVSPDPIVPAPGNPQSLNRYSYVYNNPLKFVDPSGNSAEWFNQAWRNEFFADHGYYPGASDYDFREWSMTRASLGLDSSVQEWVSTKYPTTPTRTPQPPSASTPEPRPAPTPKPTPQPKLQTHKSYPDETYTDAIQSPSSGDSHSGHLIFGARTILNRQNAPNTLLGSGLGILGGGEPRFTYNGMLIFENVDGLVGNTLKSIAPPGTPPDAEMAVVIGLAALNTGKFRQHTYEGAKWLAHESWHGVQSEALGVFYLPANIAINLTVGYDNNPLEHDAEEYAKKNWWRFFE